MCFCAHVIYIYVHTHTVDSEDYTGVTTIVTFPTGSTEQIVNVTTIGNDDPESLEDFTAVLSNVNPTATVGITEPMATVNIAANEGNGESHILLSQAYMMKVIKLTFMTMLVCSRKPLPSLQQISSLVPRLSPSLEFTRTQSYSHVKIQCLEMEGRTWEVLITYADSLQICLA